MSTVMVYDVEHETMREVPAAEAMQGMLRYAATLGAGTAARGEIERQALELAGGTR